METISIARGGPADAGAIADLSRAAFDAAFAADNTPENMKLFMEGPFSRERLMAEVHAGDSEYFIARKGDRLAGYATLRAGDTLPELAGVPARELGRLYTDPEMKGLGIGSKLMQACIDRAVALGAGWLWLGVWEHNAAAFAFYRKWGFERFGSHIFELGTDPQTDWLMRRRLP
ncbi:MAG TPA: GNAT family N-acetyltransferase [Myxococcales bacterium]|jgi:ribosomal protein S18 acetylase RimI-like enzyme|nr:GNAT family N-acetyltransferase [Myxococcales bacterium]